jgi:hypothetical protein
MQKKLYGPEADPCQLCIPLQLLYVCFFCFFLDYSFGFFHLSGGFCEPGALFACRVCLLSSLSRPVCLSVCPRPSPLSPFLSPLLRWRLPAAAWRCAGSWSSSGSSGKEVHSRVLYAIHKELGGVSDSPACSSRSRIAAPSKDFGARDFAVCGLGTFAQSLMKILRRQRNSPKRATAAAQTRETESKECDAWFVDGENIHAKLKRKRRKEKKRKTDTRKRIQHNRAASHAGWTAARHRLMRGQQKKRRNGALYDSSAPAHKQTTQNNREQ